MPKTVKVTKESKTGRNIAFKDTKNGKEMSRAQFVDEIKKGTYSDDYYVKEVNGIETPVSKPDGKEGNNLG